MKKIINASENIVEEMLTGYLSAYKRYFNRIGDPIIVAVKIKYQLS